MKRLILVVGLQKSGTTLLSRLLQETGLATNPFEGEGNAFWGNEPPFSPEGEPAGAIYRATGGERGHEIGAGYADAGTARLLRSRLEALDSAPGLWVNKNPYNSLRLPWLRALFPESTIVSLVRRPVPNVYSLAKKYVPHAESGRPPEEGWWGVKPPGWRALVQDDKVVQCARQWSLVNGAILRDRHHLDLLIPYHELCARPADVLADVVAHCTGSTPASPADLAPLRCLDDEHEHGSRLRSKNRYYAERGDLEVPASEPVEFPPFDADQRERIERLCAAVAGRIG